MKIIIYTITPIDTSIDYMYVGQTKNFTSRKNNHKKTCEELTRPHHNIQLYTIIREHGGFENWEMKPIEEYECDNNTQARIRERYWFEKYRDEGYNMCNTKMPYITENEKKEFYIKGSKWYDEQMVRNKQRYKSLKDELKELQEENMKLKQILRENNIEF